MAGHEIQTCLEEVDSTSGITYIDIVGTYVEHHGVVEGQLCLGLVVKSFEGSDVGNLGKLWSRTWVCATLHGLGEIDLKGALEWHEDTFHVKDTVIGILQSHFEAVVNLYLILADIGIIVGVAAFFSGGDLHTLNLDKVAIIGL